GPLWVGAAFSRFSADHESALSARVPHPFFFNQQRDVSGTATGVGHEETALHVQFLVGVPTGRRVALKVGGGATIAAVRQGLVSKLNYTETYPFDSAAFESASLETRSQTTLGFNLVGDFGFYFRPKVGVGVSARFSRTPVELLSPLGTTIDVNAGGLQL